MKSVVFLFFFFQVMINYFNTDALAEMGILKSLAQNSNKLNERNVTALHLNRPYLQALRCQSFGSKVPIFRVAFPHTNFGCVAVFFFFFF